jgi:hypothetical protein
MCLASRWRTTIPRQIARLKVNGLIERRKGLWGMQRGGRSWTVRLCVRPSTARQKVSTIHRPLHHTHNTPRSFVHSFAPSLIAYSCVISAADDRAVSESADAYCRISDTRVSPQLVARSHPRAIGRGVAASRGCCGTACNTGAGYHVCGGACGGCTSRCPAARKRGNARGSGCRRDGTVSTG